MKDRILVFILIFVFFMSSSYSAETLDCSFSDDTSLPFSNVLFYAHNNLSSNIAIENSVLSLDEPYGFSLECSSDFGKIEFYSQSIFSVMENPCGVNEKVIYVASDHNSRVSENYNPNYQNVLCAVIPEGFSQLDVVWYDEMNDSYNPEQLGYTCMFRTNSVFNGHVSSCDATYNLGDSYDFSVWARLFESQESLNCNADCTSKLDGRVYVGCNSKVPSCHVPAACNGALLGSYVSSSSTKEILCEAPWNKFRNKVFTTARLEVQSADGACANLIKQSQVAFLDNEQVVMNIYICQE